MLLLGLLAALIALGVVLFKDIAQGRHDDRVSGRARVVGAGASFPAPLYLRWFRDIYHDDKAHQVDYQSIGSGAGISNFLHGRVDFAGSDYPLSQSEVAEVSGGVIQLPMVAGAIVFVYNLEGVQRLNLSRDVLADIALGKIQRWNDPRLQEGNPGALLPDTKITFVARADASGTTLRVSRHIAAYNKEFSQDVGASKTPDWPQALKEAGSLIQARGNSGVAKMVEATPGAIGYVQYSYAVLPKLRMAALENRAGNMITPEPAAFENAIGSIERHFTAKNIADPAGEDAYPIISISWLIMRKQYKNPDVYPVLEAIVHYGLNQGQDQAERLGYIRFPESTQKKLIRYFESRGSSGPLLQRD